VSSPVDDERILEVAERIDGLSESGQEAALAALAPSDREEVVLTMLTQASMVEDLTDVLVAALAPEAAERYTEALRTLSWRVLRIARTGAQSEMQAAIDQLVAEHPELGEQAETVAVFLRAHGD
jgi:citrate lyase beta subunit